MGKHELRDDKVCLNCGHTVDIAYCSNCGQKNVETRQSFTHLIAHFAEDLVHYDGAFWKTIKHLLFRPAKLTKEYLAGRRQIYVAPVKLYIFISFVTFFLLILPDNYKDTEEHENTSAVPVTESEEKFIRLGQNKYSSVEDFEQKQAALPESERLSSFEYTVAKRIMEISDKKLTGKEFAEVFFHTMPKVLFIYMPIFAFFLWLFHGKKRWYFFDHGIFTLHYFSFLLLLVTICILFYLILNLIFGDEISDIATGILSFIVMFYSFFYFFRAHSRMYGEKKAISRLKSLALFIINMLFIYIALILAAAYSIYNIH